MHRKTFLGMALAMVLTASSAHADVLRVPTIRYRTIQQGIDAAAEGDTILVAPGTYEENLTIFEKSVALVSHGALVTPSNRFTMTIQVGDWFDDDPIARFTLRGFTVKSPRHIALDLNQVGEALISQCTLSSNGTGEYRALNAWECGTVSVHKSCLTGFEEVVGIRLTDVFTYSVDCESKK